MRPGATRKLIAHRLLPASMAAGVLLLLCAATASAGRGGPPNTVLKAGGQSQPGGLAWEDWTAPSGKGCVQSSGDGDGAYPKRLRLTPGRNRARFVLRRRQRPSRVQITAWHRLDSQGEETGPAETLPRTLVSRRDADGRVTAWVARFQVDVPPNYFIRLYVRWPNGKCGGPRHVLRTYSLGASS
jgi:hypothetical protein